MMSHGVGWKAPSVRVRAPFEASVLMFKEFQLFNRRRNEGVEAKQAHALGNVLGIMAALEKFLGVFCFSHIGDYGQ
jgi:hypothetical protein